MATVPTGRERAKADRQAKLLREAARLFARHGFAGVTLEDLGAAAGISGPAVYRHFTSKRALLATVLIGVSEHLLDGGQRVLEHTTDPNRRLEELIRFHIAFALADADVIRVQDRDLDSLDDTDRHQVRRLQREYVEVWVDVLRELLPQNDDADLRVRAHAVFGLINSTPHSVRGLGTPPPEADVRVLLERQAYVALLA